ncbi:cobalt-zinc-cadmium efflux system protein [Alkalibacterium olivapovliticus]|uniref:Cobalt-zinc-cadmium efflux system protein n=2 Tax=Alkalibacterium olivapovliticus TaxID=99907 RepID=A0A2T0WA43_9LACT|nr:cobalt-zinc-cadmium efflux system protein [Alkalibacterium olivapovliticus]
MQEKRGNEMSRYQIKGLHCRECSSELERKLNAVQPDGGISINYDHQLLNVSKSLSDLSAIKKVLEFEKLTLTDYQTNENSLNTESDPGNGHSHSHGIEKLVNQTATKKIAVVFYLNLFFSVIEFIFGFMFNSMAIISDAVHDLGDAMSVGLAGYFQKIATKEADDQYSFGHQRFSLLGAMVTSIVLIVGSVIVIFHAVPRVFSPEPVYYQGMFWLSIVAIAANGFSAWLMSRGSSHNESLINLHMMEDVLGWLGVLIVSIVLTFTDWYFLDPLLSIAVAVFISFKTWPLFKETVEIFLEATPRSISKKEVESDLLSYSKITNCSHLHIWSIDGKEHALTVTLSTNEADSKVLEDIKEDIRQKLIAYDITHSTIEFVYDPSSLLENY